MVRRSNRRRMALLAAFGALLVLVLAGGAAALRLQAGSTVLRFDARISPKRLSRTAATPATVRVSGRISTTDGSAPLNLTKVLIKVDDDVAFGTVGLPVCRARKIRGQNSTAAARACRRALIGRGAMGIEVAFPEAAPITEGGKVLLFNGGIKHGGQVLLAHSYLTDPTPVAILTTVKVRRTGGGHGVQATATVPTIAGGAGSVTFFKLKLGKKYSFRGRRMSVVSANCSHGRIRMKVRGTFGNGASAQGSMAPGCRAR